MQDRSLKQQLLFVLLSGVGLLATFTGGMLLAQHTERTTFQAEAKQWLTTTTKLPNGDIERTDYLPLLLQRAVQSKTTVRNGIEIIHEHFSAYGDALDGASERYVLSPDGKRVLYSESLHYGQVRSRTEVVYDPNGREAFYRNYEDNILTGKLEYVNTVVNQGHSRNALYGYDVYKKFIGIDLAD